ncbi:MAG TPA: DUF4436 family protein [Anaerolineae bacterium]|mgnify:CR=1 FL=1|nr:DUF4436 family protein [Anaerolineae bacterium]
MQATAAVPKKGRAREIIIGIIAVIALGALYGMTLNSYGAESARSSSAFQAGNTEETSYLDVDATMLSVNPIKGEVALRLTFTPQGDLTTDEGYTLASPLSLYVNSASGKQEAALENGKHINPMDVTINIYEGQANDYPFDLHKAQLWLDVERPVDEKAGTEAAAVPVAISFYGSLPGLKISAEPSAEIRPEEVGSVAVDIEITRSGTVRFFAIFAMAVMWAIALAVAFMVLAVLLRGRKVELGMFSLAASLLFGFWALRNALPGTPPVGTLSDFIAFFWAEGIAAISVTILILTWLIRPVK